MPERQPTSLCELSIPICTTSYQKDGNLKDFLILLYMYISYYIYIYAHTKCKSPNKSHSRVAFGNLITHDHDSGTKSHAFAGGSQTVAASTGPSVEPSVKHFVVIS